MEQEDAVVPSVTEPKEVSVSMSKIDEKITGLRTGIVGMKDELANILKYQEELQERILRTEGAVSILNTIKQEEAEAVAQKNTEKA